MHELLVVKDVTHVGSSPSANNICRVFDHRFTHTFGIIGVDAMRSPLPNVDRSKLHKLIETHVEMVTR